MPKMLAMTGLVISVLIVILMVAEMALSGRSLLMGIGFTILAIGLGTLSFLNWRTLK
jgi:hypothetical protein